MRTSAPVRDDWAEQLILCKARFWFAAQVEERAKFSL